MDGLHVNPHWNGQQDESSGTCTLQGPDGRGAYTVPAKSLKIVWGNDPRFWQWIKFSSEDLKSTGFEEGAMLLQVNWLEATGNLATSNFKFPDRSSTTDYEIYYIVKFQSDAFGWRTAPVKFKVRANGALKVDKVLLESYREKNNAWHEIYGGEFTVAAASDGVVEFGMYEVETDWWKGSVLLAGVKIKPKAAPRTLLS